MRTDKLTYAYLNMLILINMCIRLDSSLFLTQIQDIYNSGICSYTCNHDMFQIQDELMNIIVNVNAQIKCLMQ